METIVAELTDHPFTTLALESFMRSVVSLRSIRVCALPFVLAFFFYSQNLAAQVLSSASQTTPSPQRDPQAVSILSQCHAAMGTPQAGISLLLGGSITDTDHDANPRQLTVKIQGAYKEFSTQQYSQQTVTRGYFGRHAWIEKGGKRTALSRSETAVRIPEFIPAYACVDRIERSLMDMQYVGREIRDGIDVDHLKVGFFSQKPASPDQAVDMLIAQLDLYIDAQTHLVFAVKRESFSAASYGTHQTVETRFSAYSPYFGVQIPMQTVHLLGGNKIEKTTITTVVQGAFSDADFK
jgi:hypothetical protein